MFFKFFNFFLNSTHLIHWDIGVNTSLQSVKSYTLLFINFIVLRPLYDLNQFDSGVESLYPEVCTVLSD